MFAALHKMQGIVGALLLSVKMYLSVSFFHFFLYQDSNIISWHMQCLIYLQ